MEGVALRLPINIDRSALYRRSLSVRRLPLKGFAAGRPARRRAGGGFVVLF